MITLKICLCAVAILIKFTQSIPVNFDETIWKKLRSVNPTCQAHLLEYVQGLTLGETWAFTMFDATSKLQSGLLSGNTADMGAFHQCLLVTSNATTEKITGKYCHGVLNLALTHRNRDLQNHPFNQLNNFREFQENSGIFHGFENRNLDVGPQTPTLGWSACMPSSCNASDASEFFTSMLQLLLGMPGISLTFSDDLCQVLEDTQPELTGGAIATLSILAIILAIMLMSTLYDLYLCYSEKKPSHVAFVAFSVYTNGRKLFNVSEPGSDQIPCLNGIKAITMVWIVLGHQYSTYPSAPVANLADMQKWVDSLHSMYVAGGTVSVDTFLVMSAMLMVYGFLKATKKKIYFNIPMYYIHRYLRLTPAFGAAILISANLLKYFGSGPLWPLLIKYFEGPCQTYWWTNLLYVQNYVNNTYMCVGQSWYLTVDMQLFILSPLILWPLARWPRWTLWAVCAIILTIMGFDFYISWHLALPALVSNLNGDQNSFMNNYYLYTHTRATPWFIGVILGYYIYQIKSNEMKIPKLNQFVVFGLWGAALSVLLACLFGGHSTLRSTNYDYWGNAFHIALVRPAWGLGVCWIILGCTLGYGGPINWILSNRFQQVFGRLTYSLYLVHVTLAFVMVYSRKVPPWFSDVDMILKFWGFLFYSLVFTFVWIFAFESPMIAIEKILFAGKKIGPETHKKVVS